MRVLMTRKSCAVGMRNAILRNYLKALAIVYASMLFPMILSRPDWKTLKLVKISAEPRRKAYV